MQAFELIVGLLSGLVFVALLRRAFFIGQHDSERIVFERLDMVVAIALSALFGFLAFSLLVGGSPEQPFTSSNIVESLITQGIIGSMVLAYVGFRKIPFRLFFGVGAEPSWKLILLGITLMIGIFPFVGMVGNWINSDPSQEQEAVKFFRGSSSLQGRVLLALMAVVVAPVVEEMVFRGLLYRIFRSYFGKVAAMFFTAVLFASIHGNIPTLLPLALLSFALTAGLELQGSLLLGIAMHSTFNAISLLLILGSAAP